MASQVTKFQPVDSEIKFIIGHHFWHPEIHGFCKYFTHFHLAGVLGFWDSFVWKINIFFGAQICYYLNQDLLNK